MSIRNIFYKLNSENVKEFDVYDSNVAETYFIIRDFSNIDADEIVRLLNKNRKILVSDNTIIHIDKLLKVKKSLNNNLLFENLYISKESYLCTWFHNEYYDILKELEISHLLSVDDIVNSDSLLKVALKIKYFDTPTYLLKCLDSSLYIKKMSLEFFDSFKYDLATEFNKLIDFYKEIANNLVPSTSIFLEFHEKKSNIICNVVDNLAYEELLSFKTENIGIVSSLDISNTAIANMHEYEKHLIGINVPARIGWIDVVDLKHKIKKFGINTIHLKNIDLYDRLDEIKVCTEYGFNNIRTKSIQNIEECDTILPLYTKFDGWKSPIFNIENQDKLPCELLFFIHELKKLLSVNEIVVTLKYLEIKV